MGASHEQQRVEQFRRLSAAIRQVNKVGRECGLYYSTGPDPGPSLKQIEVVLRDGEKAGVGGDFKSWPFGASMAHDLLGVVTSIARRISREAAVEERSRALVAAKASAGAARRRTAAVRRPKRAMPAHIRRLKKRRR